MLRGCFVVQIICNDLAWLLNVVPMWCSPETINRSSVARFLDTLYARE